MALHPILFRVHEFKYLLEQGINNTVGVFHVHRHGVILRSYRTFNGHGRSSIHNGFKIVVNAKSNHIVQHVQIQLHIILMALIITQKIGFQITAV